MSTKGMSVTASRELLQELSAAYDVAVLVMHDFDITGFTIFGTLRASTPRFTYDKPPRVIDLGFRLDDVAASRPRSSSSKARAKRKRRARPTRSRGTSIAPRCAAMARPKPKLSFWCRAILPSPASASPPAPSYLARRVRSAPVSAANCAARGR